MLGLTARVAAAVVFLIGAALVSNAHLLFQISQFAESQEGQDGVSELQQRLLQLAPSLPAHGPVGFVSDLPPGDTTGDAEFHVAQYALSPRLMVRGVEAPVVVGSVHAAGAAQEMAGRQGLTVVRDFGNGLVLFGRGK